MVLTQESFYVPGEVRTKGLERIIEPPYSKTAIQVEDVSTTKDVVWLGVRERVREQVERGMVIEQVPILDILAEKIRTIKGYYDPKTKMIHPAGGYIFSDVTGNSIVRFRDEEWVPAKRLRRIKGEGVSSYAMVFLVHTKEIARLAQKVDEFTKAQYYASLLNIIAELQGISKDLRWDAGQLRDKLSGYNSFEVYSESYSSLEKDLREFFTKHAPSILIPYKVPLFIGYMTGGGSHFLDRQDFSHQFNHSTNTVERLCSNRDTIPDIDFIIQVYSPYYGRFSLRLKGDKSKIGKSISLEIEVPTMFDISYRVEQELHRLQHKYKIRK